VGISQDYSLKTQTNKQPIRKISGYKIISSHPLKYPRSKQGLRKVVEPLIPPVWCVVFSLYQCHGVYLDDVRTMKALSRYCRHVCTF
jgi:hypothetical protein